MMQRRRGEEGCWSPMARMACVGRSDGGGREGGCIRRELMGGYTGDKKKRVVEFSIQHRRGILKGDLTMDPDPL